MDESPDFPASPPVSAVPTGVSRHKLMILICISLIGDAVEQCAYYWLLRILLSNFYSSVLPIILNLDFFPFIIKLEEFLYSGYK